jgi:predicted transcriptional regulator
MHYMSLMRTTLTIRLDEESARRLDEATTRTGRSKGEILRELIRAHFTAAKSSAWDRWWKFAGITKGPRDLSTNKAYLKNLGRRRR